MATSRITCPECQSALRPAKPVPDGVKVKCPKCGKSFTTPGLMDVIDVVQEEEAPRPKAPTKNLSTKKTKPSKKKTSKPKSAAKKNKYDLDDEDDGGGIYSFVGTPEKKKEEEEDDDKPQIEYAPDMSIKDLRGPAQAAVVKPSNRMMLIGGLSALCNLFLICWSFWPMVFSDSVVDWYKVLSIQFKEDRSAMQRIQAYKEFKDLKDKDLEIVQDANERAVFDFLGSGGLFPYFGRLWLLGFFILVLSYNALAITGAVKMQNLESRRWSIASSIMMLFPFGAGGISCLLALGINFMEQITGFLGDVVNFYMIVVAVGAYLASLYAGAVSLQTLMNQKVIDGFEYVAE